jgi:hypothetical protein
MFVYAYFSPNQIAIKFPQFPRSRNSLRVSPLVRAYRDDIPSISSKVGDIIKTL